MVTGAIDRHDSPIYARIYAVVEKIPRGKVATYGQIAALTGMPRHARQAGYALAATPETLNIPWHRVINAQGRVSLRLRHWDSGSDDLQRILLESEGVVFDATGRVNLEEFRWNPKPVRSQIYRTFSSRV